MLTIASSDNKTNKSNQNKNKYIGETNVSGDPDVSGDSEASGDPDVSGDSEASGDPEVSGDPG